MVTIELATLLHKVNSLTLDQVHLEDAQAVNQAVHDHESEELPVPVAKFGSAI